MVHILAGFSSLVILSSQLIDVRFDIRLLSLRSFELGELSVSSSLGCVQTFFAIAHSDQGAFGQRSLAEAGGVTILA